MYADFSTIRLHINEKEYETLTTACDLLLGMANYIGEETDCKLIADVGEEDELLVSDFKESVLWSAVENLEKVLGKD